jgi:predicted TIM-barrel fold metal-dependent hydrolase
MLKDSQVLISVDDHVVEPPDLWTSRLPERLRDRAPQVRTETDGSEAWYYDGRRYQTLALGAVAGKDWKDFTAEPTRLDDILPGCYRVKERLEDMDQDGILASLCFPTFSRFCGQTFMEADDKDLALQCVQAYNDFQTDEWSGESGGRLIPLAILPLWDAELAATELRRTVAKGAAGIAFSENPAALGLPSYYGEYWDPVFAAAQDLDVPLCMHIGSGSKQVNTDAEDAPYSTRCVLVGLNSMVAITDLLFSQMFDRFADLKIVLSEGGIGWVPYIRERADYTWMRYRHMDSLSSRPPSDIMRDHIWFCMIDDEAGIKMRDDIGIDKIMWECDYPHADTMWPHARKRLAEVLADVPDDEVAKIVEGNARKLFRVKVNSSVIAL